MRRWHVTILILVLGGAAVNVAVAWTCALVMNPAHCVIIDGIDSRPPWLWETNCRKGFGVTHFSNTWAQYDPSFAPTYQPAGVTGTSPRWIVPFWGDLDAPTAEFAAIAPDPRGDLKVEVRRLLGSGLPLSAMWCELEREIGVDLTPTVYPGRAFIDLSLEPWHGMFPRVLPLGIDWLRFSANTLFYAVVLWLPFALRRLIRRRRGLCPTCAYPMGESVTCSECGKTLPKRAVA